MYCLQHAYGDQQRRRFFSSSNVLSVLVRVRQRNTVPTADRRCSMVSSLSLPFVLFTVVVQCLVIQPFVCFVGSLTDYPVRCLLVLWSAFCCCPTSVSTRRTFSFVLLLRISCYSLVATILSKFVLALFFLKHHQSSS